MPFAALHQLLRPVLELVDRLPAPQAAALAGARRLEAEGVVSLFAARGGDPRDFPAPGLPDVRLQGLDPEPAAALLAAAGLDLPAAVVDRLVERTGGNPLALLELPGTLEPGQLAGRAPLEAAAMLVGGSELAAPVDPSQALQMLVEAAEIASYAGDVTPTAELGRRAAALPVVDKAGEFLSDLLQGMGRVAEGDGEHGGPLLRRAIALAGTLQDPRRLMWAGIAAFFLGETEAGNALYIRAVARARQEGAVGLLPQPLSTCCR